MQLLCLPCVLRAVFPYCLCLVCPLQCCPAGTCCTLRLRLRARCHCMCLHVMQQQVCFVFVPGWLT